MGVCTLYSESGHEKSAVCDGTLHNRANATMLGVGKDVWALVRPSDVVHLFVLARRGRHELKVLRCAACECELKKGDTGVNVPKD